MTSSYSTDLKLELMVTGENAGTWGDKTNDNLTKTDFIVRPNGTHAPIPGTFWLFGSGCLLGLARKFLWL